MAYVVASDLLFTYGVVERIHNMLACCESSPPEMKRVLSELRVALANSYKSPRNLPEKSYRSNLQRIRRIAYDVEDMLDVAAAEQLELKPNSKACPKIQQLSEIMKSKLSDLEEIAHILGPCDDSKQDTSACMDLATDKAYDSKSWSWEDSIFGRETEKRQIIDWIFSPSNQLRHHPSVVSVSGIGGIGKTTLASLVYNDAQVSASFTLLSWTFACSLDIKSALVEIISSFTHQSQLYMQRMDTEALKDRLRGILEGQKYLLVMDDIGLEQLAWWEELWEVLKTGSTGSTILVTTSWESIARKIRSTRCFELQGLPETDSWSLFTSCAEFNEVAQQEYPLLEGIGRSIVNKWHGCPLAIKTMGRMLSSNRDEHLWKQIEETKIWTAFTPAYDALGISFQNTFPKPAQCFVSSAILPENRLMSREQLVYFWMAQGLLQGNEEDPRDIGHRYFNELFSRAFIQLYQIDGHEVFQLHHAAHTLAVDMMQQEMVHLPGTLFVEQGRHLRWLGDSISLDKGLASYNSTLSKVRTFLFRKDIGYVRKGCLEELVSMLSLVRVLLLDGSEFEELPEAVGNLKLLRYLSLAGNHTLKVLPDSLGNLLNLQTLDLSGCQQLQTLPKCMSSLRCLLLSLKLTIVPEEALMSWTSLHHLKICNSPNLKSLAGSIGRLTALQALQILDCSSIVSLSTYLHYLTCLRELSILNCENLDLSSILSGPTSLQYLKLQGLPKLSKFPRMLQNAADSLRHLIVSNCENLSGLPECLHECINLVEMVIDNCPNIVSLPKAIHVIRTLQVLKIFNCPILTARCEDGVGEDWPLLSRIPIIQLQHQVIQNRAASTLKEDSGITAVKLRGRKDFCISHGGGRRLCQWPACNKEAAGGGQMCQFLGCTKSGEGSTDFCIIRSGDRICNHVGCSKEARGNSGLCRLHGGSRRCRLPDCTKVAHGSTAFCIAHGGGRRCQSLGCTMSAQGETHFCIAHGSGALYVEKNLEKQDVKGKEVEYPRAITNFQEDEDVLVREFNVAEEMERYCSLLSLLPENYEIEKETLIQLWMAVGEYMNDEPIEWYGGEDCFNAILNGGYILHSGSNFMTGKDKYRINSIKINELLLDRHQDKHNSYLKWDNGYQWNDMLAPELIQHVSLVCNDIIETVFQTLQQFNKLRTLLFLGNLGHRVKQIPYEIFLGFKNLQALDLSRTQIRELPSSIGHMIHLKYLDLSWTLIKWLPDIICSFAELQTLKLRGCSNLLELPKQFKRLTNLRHLDLDVLCQLETMPTGMGALVNLLTLSAFLVGTENGCKIQELRELNNLFGKLCIAQLEHVENADEAREATLYKKEHLEKLELRWTASEISGTHNNSDAILECLQPSTSLEELKILCYEGSTFPSWISNPEYNKLTRVIFYKCENLPELPLIEQLPFLKHLNLTKMISIRKIERRGKLEEDDIAFPKLETLEINEMQSLKVWDWKKRNEGDFISLTQLIINDCPELLEFEVLPYLSSIKHFEIRECPKLESLSDIKLADSLEELIVEDCPLIQKKCLEQEGEDWYKIKHIPTKSIQEVDKDEDE